MSTVSPEATCRNEYSSYTSRGGGKRTGYDIRQIEMCGEKLSADSEAILQEIAGSREK